MLIRVKYLDVNRKIVKADFAAVICDNSQGLCGLLCFANASDIGTYNHTFIDSEDIIHVCAIWPDNI